MNNSTTSVSREEILVLRLSPDLLDEGPTTIEAGGAGFLAVLPQTGLGAPSVLACERVDGRAHDRIVLSYRTQDALCERTWNKSSESAGVVVYDLQGDTSSRGYISAAA